MSTLVIAIDGPSGSGKSSTARGVAERLGFAYLDTGAMYRAMTWALLQRGIDVADVDAVASTAGQISIEGGTDPLSLQISADGVDVSSSIRNVEVTAAVSAVSAVSQVRRLLVAQQRSYIAQATKGIVVEGRDIGSVVAPDARVKVYLVAHQDARAARRTAELGGDEDNVAVTGADLARRDRLDSSRATSPLVRADDAVVLDTTERTLQQVIDEVVRIVDQRR